MDRQRLPARARGARRHGGPPRRHPRAPPGVPRRHAAVHGRVGARRPRAEPGGAHRGARDPGHGRVEHARPLAGDRQPRLPARGASAGARHLDGRVRDGAGGRPAGGRRADRRARLALDLLAVPPVRGARADAHAHRRAGVARRDRRAPDRPCGPGHADRRPRRGRHGADRGQGLGLGRVADDRPVRRRAALARRVLVRRAPRTLAAGRVLAVPQRPVLRRQRRRLLPGRLLLGRRLLPAAVPAGRARLLAARQRHPDPAGHRPDDPHLAAGRPGGAALRHAARDDRRDGVRHRRRPDPDPDDARHRLRARAAGPAAARRRARPGLRADVGRRDGGHARREGRHRRGRAGHEPRPVGRADPRGARRALPAPPAGPPVLAAGRHGERARSRAHRAATACSPARRPPAPAWTASIPGSSRRSSASSTRPSPTRWRARTG